jgi:hypothetical protein
MKHTVLLFVAPLLVGLLFACLFLTGCGLEPDDSNPAIADGIVIYSGNNVLNGREHYIVTNRVQQLRVIVPSGHRVVWESSNPGAVDVSQTGLIRAGRSQGKKATITASSAQDTSIRAEVFFITKGLR